MSAHKTQKELVVEYIAEFGHITSFQAFSDLGITQLGTVVFHLKEDGYRFDKDRINTENRRGDPTHYDKYRIVHTPDPLTVPPDSTTPTAKVLAYLLEHGSISQVESTRIVGVSQLSAAICTLREGGHVIDPSRERRGRAEVTVYHYRNPEQPRMF